MEYNLPPTITRCCSVAKSRLESEHWDAPAHIWQQLHPALVKLQDTWRGQVLSGAVQGADYFSASLKMACIYEFHLTSGLSLSQYVIKTRGRFIVIGENSGSDR